MSNTVLLIENDEATVAACSEALQGAGYTVESSGTADEGTQRANELAPSLILINLATPGANGLELCKSLHNTEALANVPIILLTLREGKFEPVYTKLYGIVSFLKKPFEPSDLIALAQEYAPITEVEEPAAEDTVSLGPEEGAEGFGQMDMEGAEAGETEDEAVFSIDDAQDSLTDLQESFQQPLDEEGPAGEDLEGTQDISMGGEEGIDFSSNPLEEGEGGLGEPGAEEGASEEGGWGEPGAEEGASEEGGWGEPGAEEGASEEGGWGEPGAEEGASEEGGWGEPGAEEGASEEGGWGEMEADADMGAGDEDDADATLKVDLAESGWDQMDIDDSEATMQMDQPVGDETPAMEDAGEVDDDWGDVEDSGDSFESDSTMTMEEGGGMDEIEGDMPEEGPAFGDEDTGGDETFMDDSIAGDEEASGMDLGEEEDYAELFEEQEPEEEDAKGKKKKKKKEKKKKKKGPRKKEAGSPKRVLILLVLLLVIAGAGFGAYTFFLSAPPEPTTEVQVTSPKDAEAPPPDLEGPPEDLLKELDEEPPAEMAEEEPKKPEPKPKAPAPVAKKETPKKTTPKPKKVTPAKPAPAPMEAGTARKGAYYVQFGVFGVKSNVKRMTNMIEDASLVPLVQVITRKDGKEISIVLLDEPMDSWSAASKRAKSISSSTGLDTAVYKIK
jgi:CheY-like chemotaxis protein/flagellar basal body-associated protein FliL